MKRSAIASVSSRDLKSFARITNFVEGDNLLVANPDSVSDSSRSMAINRLMRDLLDLLEGFEYAILTENARVEFLARAYGERIFPLLVKKQRQGKNVGIHKLEKQYESIERVEAPRAFIKWIIDYIDPTHGKYAQWIVVRWLRGDLDEEDFIKARKELETFERVKRLPGFQADINRYRNLSELMAAMEPHVEQARELSKRQVDKAHDAKMHQPEHAIVHLDNEHVKIVELKTYEASKHFGRNTKWCTSGEYDDGEDNFDWYTSRGPLYVILDKKNNRRWQFHAITAQLMDERDEEAAYADLRHLGDEVGDFLADRYAKRYGKECDFTVAIADPQAGPLKVEVFKNLAPAILRSPSFADGENLALVFSKTDYWAADYYEGIQISKNIEVAQLICEHEKLRFGQDAYYGTIAFVDYRQPRHVEITLVTHSLGGFKRAAMMVVHNHNIKQIFPGVPIKVKHLSVGNPDIDYNLTLWHENNRSKWQRPKKTRSDDYDEIEVTDGNAYMDGRDDDPFDEF